MSEDPAQAIPDDAVAYVPGFGETTVGALRAAKRKSDEMLRLEAFGITEADVRMWEDMVTRNLHFGPDGRRIPMGPSRGER